jgi:hypothetical protein
MGSAVSAPARKQRHGRDKATTGTTAAPRVTPATTEAAAATPATTEATAETPPTAAQDVEADKFRASPATTSETPAATAEPVEVQPPSSSAYRDPIYVYGVAGASRTAYVQPPQPVIVQQPMSKYVVQDYFTCRNCGYTGPARIVNLGPSCLA